MCNIIILIHVYISYINCIIFCNVIDSNKMFLCICIKARVLI